MATSSMTEFELIEDLQSQITALADDANAFWLMYGASLVFFMQSGFAFLEVGCVQQKNAKSILLVNIIDASLSALTWWGIGYAIAFGGTNYGTFDANPFIGTDGWFLTGKFRNKAYGPAAGYDWAWWLFQWAFCATTATIVNGAVVERVQFGAYIIYSLILTGVIYPLIVHWGWSATGWASAFNPHESRLLGCGIIDFAGSGVIHTTGGCAAMIGAYMIGPRKGRFVNGEVIPIPQLSWVYQTLGALFLWFGWFGFNGCSSSYISGKSLAGARAMVNSTIAAGSGCISALIVAFISCKDTPRVISPAAANNGLLGGLVAVTAGCGTVDPEGAFVIGVVAGAVYVFSSKLMLKLKIDDVVDAAPVHLFCGSWGFLATGLFTTESQYAYSYYADRANHCAGAFYGGKGAQLGAQIIFWLVILGFCGSFISLTYLVCKITVGLRVSAEEEDVGMDQSKHGGKSDYEMADNKLNTDTVNTDSVLLKDIKV